MRAIWKGHIRFSLVTIPIRMYSAIESGSSISFRQLHKEDNGRIGYQKVCKVCNEAVSTADIVKGYEHESDQYVIVESEDLQKIKLKSTKVIDIEAFVDAEEVNPALFDTPYFAGPDGEVASKAYALLCETLKNSNKLGIGKVVLRDRESVVLIAPQGPGLMMYKLRYPKELRQISQVPNIEPVEADDAQLKLAQTLVDSMAKPFSELELEDKYRAAVMEIIEAKIEGKEIVTTPDEEAPVVDIMTALQESIDLAKTQKKPLKKAIGKKDADSKEDKKTA
ncbi:MAG: Ku protein [Saprospiraceae bacterium]|nr:Ku protein [Saprospiraceae bacterium]